MCFGMNIIVGISLNALAAMWRPTWIAASFSRSFTSKHLLKVFIPLFNLLLITRPYAALTFILLNF